jgi:hypothetical protein
MYDLTPYLYSWQRVKSLDQAQPGTFTLSLFGEKDKQGRTIADLLMPMDYIEIRASKNGKTVNGEYPIIMRGFVDTATDSLTFSASGGPSEPRITIAGRDYTKLLLVWQVLYLWTQNTLSKKGNLASLEAQAYGLGLYYNFHLPINPESITSFFEAVMKNMVNPILDGLRKHNYGFELPGLNHNFVFPDYPMSSINILSYSGSYWNLMQYIASPPFGELFVWDDTDSPILTSRLTPYKTAQSDTPYPSTLDLQPEGDFEDVFSYSVSRTDSDLYTYFLTYGSTTQMVGLTMPTFVDKSNGVLTQWASLYGTRPNVLDTSWIAEYDPSNPGQPNSSAHGIGNILNEWMLATLGENQYFWAGSLQCHGSEDYRIGTYWNLKQRNESYYLKAIEDTFLCGLTNNENDTWTANLTIERGRPAI